MAIAARLDRFQRRHPAAGYPLAVAYKIFDDQGNFPDDVHLTHGDRRAYASYVQTERHKTFETVEVSFDQPPPEKELGRRRPH